MLNKPLHSVCLSQHFVWLLQSYWCCGVGEDVELWSIWQEWQPQRRLHCSIVADLSCLWSTREYGHNGETWLNTAGICRKDNDSWLTFRPKLVTLFTSSQIRLPRGCILSGGLIRRLNDTKGSCVWLKQMARKRALIEKENTAWLGYYIKTSKTHENEVFTQLSANFNDKTLQIP